MNVEAKMDLQERLKLTAHQAVAELEGISTVTDAAKYVPVQYFGVMAGESGPSYQDGTFIVQKHNIVAIKRYVNAALALPVDLTAIERQLGYIRSDKEGLEPADIQNLHQKIHQHALSWGTLERDTKDLGGRLDLFSSGFIRTGNLIVEHLKSFQGYEDLTGTIDTLTEVERARMAAIPLGNSATEKVENLNRYFTRMKDDIESFCRRISAVKALATEFSRKISEDLLPLVKAKLSDAERAGFDQVAEEEQLRVEIKGLDERIAEKLKEYDSLVGYAFTGLVFGPIGVAITGGIFGSKAEATRAEKNSLIETRDNVLKNMDKARLSKLLMALRIRLENMKSQMIDAEQGAKNLEDVWAIIWMNVEESRVRLSEVDNAFDLSLLVLDIQGVVAPWETIKGHAANLSYVFNSVVD
ncbi:alpha-xenorhabdolysin family binary toxin subunit A [Pseudomonas sp. 6D_7.1_Bac1]|uniref:alpha-xenorhabdolysin family binary toxin subunit A n=1 Tax=Pseudomonas sp. 6D_7.1_Bac1 TaxID=2971615 RepID=UPI0021C9B8C9|nr:alpha-xenorhabdolysin family binary toxin subunit A [Pseudomonas sp. 6D_7.1_Bac1]MCU1751263.1 alpha-xenorhabdolysin family binary toxin subunit A [Pseudomonas sp. 6D_7.1_Bac1]